MEALLQHADNIYEAVTVMARRARQVNDDQKIQIEMEMDVPPVIDNRENEDFDEVEIDREALLREHKKYPKPTKVAVEEMLKGEIQYRYIDSEEEKD